MIRPLQLCAVLATFAGSIVAVAQTTLISQARSISATTTADGQTVTVTASDFSPFIQTVAAATSFPAAGGTTAPNTAAAGIDCRVDPNAIRAVGSLQAAGGLNISGQAESGEAAANILVHFSVASPTPYHLQVTPRPSTDPHDRFRVEFENAAGDLRIVRLREDQPAQTVDTSGVLPPGEYVLNFEVEYTVSGPSTSRDFDFNLALTNPCGIADFDADGDSGTDADIEAFFACLAGNCCSVCGTVDFNADGDSGTDADIEAFFRVLGGGAC